MATEAVVSFVVERLGNLLIEEAQLLRGVHDEVRLIERELRRMQCFLKDADEKQKGDARVRNLVAEIRVVSYDADDIIDTFILSEAAKIARWRRGVLVGCLSLQQISELKTRYKVGKEIRQIKLKIAEISNCLVNYGIKDINDQAGGQDARLGGRRRLNAMFEEKDVVGFEEDMTKLKERLIKGESRRSVISLVGMGGTGKTTLAKKIYHDVRNDFDCNAFIYLSQQYAIKDVLIRIIECTMSLPRKQIEKLNEEDLGEKLSAYLSGKRYLVVIDDIWTAEAWEILKRILPDDSNKSRVMLTTRKKDVALRADQLSPPHEMCLLNDKEGWELFMKRIFSDGNSCPSDVEETGRQILAKCHGLPLAIAVLGGLLSTRDVTLSEWSKVLKSVAWHLSESPDNPCGEILALSYYDLPHYLKPCFLYFGLFPEDFEIRSKRLIRLWIAEGFIQQRGDEVLEDVAEDYLNELISRSMIQVASRRCNRSVRTCRIHDLLRELSIDEAVQNNFFTIGSENETNSPSTRVRRLAVYSDTEMQKTINRSTATLRTVLCFSEHATESLKIGGKLIRVLDVEDDEGFNEKVKLPKKIGESVHLRYLNLGLYDITRLLISIGDFSYLQTLELHDEGTLPNAIWNLERLRHLHAYWFDIDGPPRLNNLRNIQTLCLKAGSWIEDGLDKMTNLRKMGIWKVLIAHHKALSDSIEKLCSLRSLKILSGNSISSLKSFAHHSHLYKMFLTGQIEKLPDFPPNLAKLTLARSQLKQDAIAILEKLPHLRILRLYKGSYCSKKMIFSSEGFPQLEYLRLEDLDLEEWIVEEGAMSSLKSVELESCKGLQGCEGLKIFSKHVRHLLGIS
ncbi:putative disease resistance protein [Cinnamomum micranthum f. kanehirae]|uniref:Putative disease resistance protein n=1 Tax=Cinnamomum micranthum f. kanehirae TaxID=337451 RepID=A0A443N9Q3_9MAGN|nr:putative disease resistance protein [Cinnamomum micranthum f. kanehirae]